MSNFSIMSVREMIDMAFGLSDVNIVNFKTIQTILYLLARQLRILERRVEVDLNPSIGTTSQTSITVTEVKLHAAVPKPKVGKTSGNENEKQPKKMDKSMPLFGKSKGSAKEDPLLEKRQKIKKQISSEQVIEKDSIRKKGESPLDKTRHASETVSSLKNNLKRKASDASYGSVQKDYHKLLEVIEEQRERELRVIRQRANSREEAEKSPTPMASLDSMEMQYEKLLVVERLPPEEATSIYGQKTVEKRKLSIVTQDQFQALAAAVRELQSRFGGNISADFPENIDLMHELRKGASLTDAMAALQLSARLDAAEKTLTHMLSLITNLASRTPGLDLTIQHEDHSENQTLETLKLTQSQPKKSHKIASEKKTSARLPTSLKTASGESTQTTTLTHTTYGEVDESEELNASKDKNLITCDDLDFTLQELHNEILKEVTTITNANSESANSALKLAKRLETKLEASLHLETRMNDLETLVSDYADQINILDTGLSSQMTYYQEQLTQMQQDLENGLENMAEALANTGGDTAAMAELNTNFTNLQEEFDKTLMNQKELQEVQTSLHLDLQTLWQQIELLKETKPDREEIADALRDKAGLKALNGLVSQHHFDAVRGDFEKRIGAAYEKFNNQEMIWQKAIDDIFREINDKADWLQLNLLRDDINKNIETLNSRIQAMMEILGEPRAAATTRRLFRDAACLSCASPANMELIEHDQIPQLPAFTKTTTKLKLGAEEISKLKGDGDHDACYPGRPVPHPIDRSQFCQRYCGGGGTAGSIIKRIPLNMNTSLRVVSTAMGCDGKTYIVEEKEQPCLPCNISNTLNSKALADQDPAVVEVDSGGMTPSDFITQDKPEYYRCGEDNSVSVTPTLPMDYDF